MLRFPSFLRRNTKHCIVLESVIGIIGTAGVRRSLLSKIIAFDVSDEVFHSIRPPPDNVKTSIQKRKNLVDWSKIMVWSNSIALFFYGKGRPAFIDMGIKESDSRGAERSYTWTKYLTMGPLVGIKRPLAFLNDDLLYLETDDSEITSFNIRTFILSDHTIPCQDLRSSPFIVFARSLVSLKRRKKPNRRH